MITPFRLVSLFLIAACALQLSFWMMTRDYRPLWIDVPPAPSPQSSSSVTLGDSQFAYRSYSVSLQNIGDVGGRVTPLRELNYNMLTKWLDVMDSLDPQSNFMPMLVAYYFSATDNPDQLDGLITYLRRVGLREAAHNKKWRWLVSAIYLAKHKQKDLDKALSLAQELSALQDKEVALPSWAKNMPAFILLEQGDKQSAYELTVRILQEGIEDMHPNEVNFMVDYLCRRILDEPEAAVHPLCAQPE
jgi:hypothetical protein|tara:strand:+ start:138 stop:875 length:738 start_codon:yes stop_codon:yes gene_type:complete